MGSDCLTARCRPWIQWGKPDDADPLRLHPRNSLPRSGVSLQGIAVTHPSADKLQLAFDAIGLTGIAVHAGPANITATFQSPRHRRLEQPRGIGVL